MKKLIPALISTAIVFPFTAQAEGPINGKVYGKINAAYLSENVNGSSDSYLHSNASRIGFKGKTKLDNNMTVLYKLEYEIDPTEKAASSKTKSTGGTGEYTDSVIFKQRNAIIGLKTGMGTFMMGIHDTPTKLAQDKIDLFNDLAQGDIKNLVRGEVRATDIFAYQSPNLNGLSLMAAVTQYEDGDEGSSDAASVSLSYTDIDKLYLAVAMDSEVAGYDVTRIVAQYKWDAFTFGAMLNSSEESNAVRSKSKSSKLLSVAYKIDKITLKGQYGSGDEKNESLTQTSVGIDYKLGKKSKVFAYATSLKDNGSTDKSVNGLGIEHKF